MNGWKTKTAGVAAILGGLAAVVGAIATTGFSMETLAAAKLGFAGIVTGLGMLGLGHKLDKLTNALNK